MDKNLTYAGIGSRSTPEPILIKMREIAKFLAKKGYTLRSGGARGADYDGFEIGCDAANGPKEIYLPWKGFNNNLSNLEWTQEGWNLAAKFHPNWDNLKLGAKQLMARNSHQILGWDLKSPSCFVVCWTEGGKMIGGTSQALRIAIANNIKIYNLGEENGLDKFREHCKII